MNQLYFNMKTCLYKPGDRVQIKDHYDPGCNEYSYKYTFTHQMLSEYGGGVFTIRRVTENYYKANYKQPDDNCLYELDGDPRFFQWASSMFTLDKTITIF